MKLLEPTNKQHLGFQDAIRINGNDQDARRKFGSRPQKITPLADKRSQGENSLEKRLERLLEDVRMIRDNYEKLKKMR